jgi:hypothetical protein
MKSSKSKLLSLLVSLLVLALCVYLYLNLFYHRDRVSYEEFLGFPYLGEEDLRFGIVHAYEKWPLDCNSNKINVESSDRFTAYYYCMVKKFVVNLPVKNLSESKLLQYFPYPALTSPQIYLVDRFVLRVNFTLPSDAILGIYRVRSSSYNPTPTYFFSVRFGLPYCFTANITPHNITLVFEHYAIINGKRFEGLKAMWTGYIEKCLDPFWPLLVSVSEDTIRREYGSYEALKELKPGENISIEFIVELYMSKEQAEGSRGYIELTFAYPYVAIQYPQKRT